MISVILPTIRPENLARTLNSIESVVPHEVIIIADFLGDGHSKVKWIYDPVRKGTIDAIDRGYKAAHGDYIFVINDETVLHHECLDALYDKAKSDNSILYTPRHEPYFPFFYYGKFFAAFPFASRKLLNRCGGLFDTVYKSFYADPDLSLRVYAIGSTIKIVEDAVITHLNRPDAIGHQDNVNNHLKQDQAIFKKRWAHLGEFKDP